LKNQGSTHLESTSLLRNNLGLIHRVLLFSLLGVLAICGCNKTQPAENNASSAPPAAPAAAPAPEQSSTPAASAPAPAPPEPAPAPTPTAALPPPPPRPPPPPKVYTVPSGTALTVRIAQELSSKTSNVGDPFSGTLAQSVRVGGVTVLKAGIPVSGTVTSSKKQGKFKGEGDLGIQLSRVGPYEVTSQELAQTVKGKGKRTGAMVGGGAGGGALIGGLAGGGKGALIGGLVGAGAGTAGAVFTGNKGVTIAAESVVTFVSSSPITVTLKTKPAAEE
jgi:hypothetical protein